MNRMEMKIIMVSNGKNKFLLAAALAGLSAVTLAPTNVVNADEIYYENQYGANQNYLRYEAVDGQLKDAEIVNNRTFDTLAYEASDNSYVKVNNKGSVTFTAKEGADGLTMRYSIKDGDKGEVKVYVNGNLMRTFHLDSSSAYQYVDGSNVYDTKATDHSHARFSFDEVHGFFGAHVNPGDTVTIENNGVELALDFVELENVPAPIPQPENSISITDSAYGAEDGKDSTVAFEKALKAAIEQKKTLYIPVGEFKINKKIDFTADGLTVTGAGMWYSKLNFTTNEKGGGGFEIGHDSNRLTFSNFAMTSALTSRYDHLDDKAQYKAFAGSFGKDSRIDHMWIEHFECGAWIGDYDSDMRYTDHLVIENSRIRNNLADGVNFTQGTRNSVVRNSNIRNNGDDSLATFSSSIHTNVYAENNSFEHNTIELGWRAGGVGIFGGKNHKVTNNLIKDSRGGAGIRVSTVFAKDGEGLGFKDNNEILIKDNMIVNSGTTNDFYWDHPKPRSNIDFEETFGPIKGITVQNNVFVNPVYTAEAITHAGVELDGKVKIIDSNVQGNTSSDPYKVDASMSHSVENGKEVYNFTYGDQPTFLPENSTAFERDYNYRGEREVDGHIIRLWEHK